MQQSKLESAIESTANIASGFVISYGVWMMVVVPLIEAGILVVGPAGHAFLITCLFTVTSWLRSYFWRRYFNAGMHKIAQRWAQQLPTLMRRLSVHFLERVNEWAKRR